MPPALACRFTTTALLLDNDSYLTNRLYRAKLTVGECDTYEFSIWAQGRSNLLCGYPTILICLEKGVLAVSPAKAEPLFATALVKA